MRNVLYASTRGWNVGDDFIRMGCERLVEVFWPKHNRMLYDKAPHVRQAQGGVWEGGGEFHANSAGAVKHHGMRFDLLVAAGTPENSSGRMMPFFDWTGVPCIGLALGGNPAGFSPPVVEKWRRCEVLTTRSRGYLEEYRKRIGHHVECLPCTSLFSADSQKSVGKAERVALGWKSAKGVSMNSMDSEQYQQMVDLYRELMKSRPALDYVIVCHHIDEVDEAMREFPSLEVRHSYDEHGYFGIYGDCDFVVSPKVHGCGVCASMGIPGVLLPTDRRADTADGFLSFVTWDLDGVLDRMKKASEISEKLHLARENAWDRTVRLLEPVFGRL